MKRRDFLGVAALAAAVLPPAHPAPAREGSRAGGAPDPTYGQHGMVLFGGPDGLYASHLPMFHAPHDYQVVLRVHLDDALHDRALRATLGAGTALWTVAPEDFALARLARGAADPLRRFTADLVEGHFEQGGTTRYHGAGVVVDQVLMFRHLAGTPGAVAQAHYLQVGRGTRRYLVKLIDSRPDFDHIVALTVAAGTPTTAVAVDRHGVAEPPAAAFTRALPGAAVRGTVYYGRGDLR